MPFNPCPRCKHVPVKDPSSGFAYSCENELTCDYHSDPGWYRFTVPIDGSETHFDVDVDIANQTSVVKLVSNRKKVDWTKKVKALIPANATARNVQAFLNVSGFA